MSREFEPQPREKFVPIGIDHRVLTTIDKLFVKNYGLDHIKPDDIPSQKVESFVSDWRDRHSGLSAASNLQALQALNGSVITHAMDITFKKIEEEGMPWPYDGGPSGRKYMVKYVNSIVDDELDRRRGKSFLKQIRTERRLLVVLRQIGDMHTTGSYEADLERFNDDEGGSDSNLLQAAMLVSSMFKPLNLMAGMFMGREARDRLDSLTGDYENIRLAADRWLGGIYDSAINIPEAYHPSR